MSAELPEVLISPFYIQPARERWVAAQPVRVKIAKMRRTPMARWPGQSRVILAGTAGLVWGCTINNPAFVLEMPRGDAGDAAFDTPAAPDALEALDNEAPAEAAIELPAPEMTPAEVTMDAGSAETSPPDATAEVAPEVPPSFPGQLRYTFESGLEGWQDLRLAPSDPSHTGLRRADFRIEGSHSLAMDVNTTAANTKPIVGITGAMGALKPPPGTVVHFRIFVPATDALVGVQPFILYYRSNDPAGDPTGWCCGLVLAEDLVAGAWNALTLTVPNTDINRTRGVLELGIEFQTRGAQRFTAYVDAISW